MSRGRWYLKFAGISLAIAFGLTSLLSLIMVGPVHARTIAVIGDQIKVRQTQARTEFWPMLAGTKPVDDSSAGRLARDLRPSLKSRNPAGALLKFYIHKGQYPGIEKTLGLDVIQNEKVKDGNTDKEIAQGYLAPLFVAYAVQATPQNVADLAEPLPHVQGLGSLTWGTYTRIILTPAALYLALLVLTGLVLLGSASVEGAQKRKEHAAYLASLSPLAREVYDLREQFRELARQNPGSSSIRKALAEAERDFTWLAKDASREFSQVEAEAKAAHLRSQLAEIVPSAREGLAAYRRLSS